MEIREIVNNVLLNIAKYYPLTDTDAINMYAFMSGFAGRLLNSPQFDKTYTDYTTGKFWSREWEQSGADPSAMRREYPFMTLENVKIMKRNGLTGCTCYEFWVLIGDQLECDGCAARSEVDIYTALFTKANAVLKELNEVYAYTYDGSTKYLSKNYVNYWQTKNPDFAPVKGPKLLDDNFNKIDIQATDLGNADGVIGVAFNFVVCGPASTTAFNYEPTPPADNIGTTKCEIC